jgi:hypothetical protein
MKKLAMMFILTFATIGIGFTGPVSTDSVHATTPTIATPPPETLPIGSKAMLRAYAFEQVCGSSISIWSEEMMWSSDSVTNVYFHPEVAPSLDDAMQAIMFNHFNFKVSDKTKPLSVYAELHNKDGMALFSGNVNASISNSGQILCPTGVKMKMNPFVVIEVGENVQGASIRLNNGEWDSLTVWNGYLYFRSDYTEQDGTLILNYNDGNTFQQIPYSLRAGDQVPLVAVSGNVDAYVQDFQSFIDNGMIASAILYANVNGFVGDDHEAPVASITITSTRPVKFYCVIRQAGTNTVLERPQYGWLYKKGSSSEMPVSLLPGQWSQAMTLDPGEWFFYPETSLFDSPPPVIIGGKG